MGELFKNYLDNCCFDVLECESFLMIFLKIDPNSSEIPDENSKENLIISAIEATVLRIFKDQERAGRVPLKRKRKRKEVDKKSLMKDCIE